MITLTLDLKKILKALVSGRRIQVLKWLKDPVAHFPAQEHGDPIEHIAYNLFITNKLGVTQPAASRHLKVLTEAGLVIATPRKGWIYYRRNEAALDEAKRIVSRI
jgi:DNA-binding transcriptional ArsR family regulator